MSGFIGEAKNVSAMEEENNISNVTANVTLNKVEQADHFKCADLFHTKKK